MIHMSIFIENQKKIDFVYKLIIYIIKLLFMTNLITLLKNNDCYVKYKNNNIDCSDEELLSNIIALTVTNKNLTNIPSLPNCKRLLCNGNLLISLPDLPNCITLNCSNNPLNTLPKLPNCKILCCNNCQLKFLPCVPNCRELYCWNNCLISLPYLPKCKLIVCDNKLIYLPNMPKCRAIFFHNRQKNNIDYFKKLWRFRNFFLALKYFKFFYRFMLNNISKKKLDLHLELKYSPNLNFYKNDPYYKHFIENQKI